MKRGRLPVRRMPWMIAILAGMLLLAAGCGNSDDISSLPEAQGGGPPPPGPVIAAVITPYLVAVNDTVPITAPVSGEPNDTLTYDVVSGAGTFAGLPGTITLDGAGQGTILLSYTASPTPGPYSHTLSVTDSTGLTTSRPFNLGEVPPFGALLGNLGGPAPENMALAFDGANLWAASRASLTLYKIDPASGAVLNAFPTPNANPRGMVWDGATLWLGDGSSTTIWQIDPASGTPLGSIPLPLPGVNYISGLGYDGTGFWISGTNDGLLHQTDLGWNLLGAIPAPGAWNRGMTWGAGVIFHADGNCAGPIRKVDPASGAVLDSFPGIGTGCPDLAFDGLGLWVGDFTTPDLFRVSPGTIPAF